MKRDRIAEKEKLLLETEAELRKELLMILPSVVETGWHLFLNSNFNSHNFPAHFIGKNAEKLFETSHVCIGIRETLNLPTDETIGKLFVMACEEYASSNPQSRGPRKLAAALLEQLNNQ